MGTIYRNGKVNTIIKNGKIYGFASSGGGGIPIEIVEKTNTITTISTGGNDASISIDYYEDGTLIDSTGTILYSTVNNRTKAINFHLTKIWYDATHTNWRIEALCDCYYNDNIYTEGETIRDWSYAVSVDFDVNNISRRLISPILSGTTTPTSAQGSNGQIYLQYENYTYDSFMNDTIIVRTNNDDNTDKKLFFIGFENTTSGTVLTDTDLIAYFSDISNGYLKDAYSFDTADSNTATGIIAIANNNDNYIIRTFILGWTQYKGGIFYGMIDLNATPIKGTGTPPIQQTENIKSTYNITNLIINSYLKVNNTWQNLIGSDINDVGNTSETATYINMTSITLFKESNMYDSSYENLTTIHWDGGETIGNTYYYTTAIDVTNINKLYYNLQSYNCYGNGSQPVYPRWNIMVGLRDIAPTSALVGNYDTCGFTVGNQFVNSNTDYGTQEIDVSNLTGNYYLVVNAHGWNAIISNLRYE